MKKVSMLGSVAALIGGLVLSNYALAQSSESANDEQIIIVAPRITHESQSVIGPGNRGVYDTYSLTKEVSYSDLDLSKPSDADRLVQRIKDTAKASCNELKDKYPDPPHAAVTTDQECVKTATEQAMVLVTALVDHAEQVAIVTPSAPPPPAPVAEVVPTPAPVVAEAAPAPEPAPAVEAEATTVPPPKQDRN